MKSRTKRAGFTLVELAVVTAIAGIALTATAGAVTSGARLARTTIETRAAMRASQSIMERIRATPFVDIASTFNGRQLPMSDASGGDSTGVCGVTVTTMDTGSSRWSVLQVTVTAAWRGTQGQSYRKFVTYVCDRTVGSSLGSPTTVPTN